MENNSKKAPRRGPGMGPAPIEKAKNFKQAITRLIKELKPFHILIIIRI